MLKKTNTNSGLNKSSSSVLSTTSSRASSSTGGKLGTSRANESINKLASRSNSQTRHEVNRSQVTTHATDTLMSCSLNLPSGVSLPSSSQANDSFRRRKMYNPIRAVELDKLRRQSQQHQYESPEFKPEANVKSGNIKLYESNSSILGLETNDGEYIDPSRVSIMLNIYDMLVCFL